MDKTTDNFYQNHNILSATWTPSSHWSHSLSLHYTYGYGYYKEFKNNAKLPSSDSSTRMQRATRSRSLTSFARRDSPSIPTAWYTIPTTRMSTGMLSAD